ncbi:hypothetical protein [Streptomyces hydrogenans]|uniref:Uncharacterized protein n=1 Tax=Streptomyces hydrogenans TaxID=1873719 RepID=A0ABQ3P8S4_9ACTN|nr:hypothetical protein [Streptomyces hydrogenans]GHG37445.1 hypothetical protein GCM10018784_58870 [Streptomyces hydrogenans]GHI21417.1 hypothetical protein Shyd_27880 [Streptomyces hydrogenans]
MSDEPAVATEEETGPAGSGTKNGRAAAEAEKGADGAAGAARETGREDADEDTGPEGPEDDGPDDDGPEDDGAEDAEEDAEPEDSGRSGGMTPKQARRLRVAAASVLLVVMGVVLVIRLASRTSVLVVGVYGLAMILCGVVIELARNGRTRLGTWLLVGGLAAALAFDWLILP